jgi:hypothetical protein
MPNIWKSIVTNLAPQRAAGQPAVPIHWAIASGGTKPHSFETNFCDAFCPDGRGATFLMGEVSASGSRNWKSDQPHPRSCAIGPAGRGSFATESIAL